MYTDRIKHLFKKLDEYEEQHPILYPVLVCLVLLPPLLYASYWSGYPKSISDTLRNPNVGWLQFWGAVIGGLLTLGGVFLTLRFHWRQEVTSICPYLDAMILPIEPDYVDDGDTYFACEFRISPEDKNEINHYLLKITNCGGHAVKCYLLDLWWGQYSDGIKETIVSSSIFLGKNTEALDSHFKFQVLDNTSIHFSISKELSSNNRKKAMYVRMHYSDKFNNRFMQEFSFIFSNADNISKLASIPYLNEKQDRYKTAASVIASECIHQGKIDNEHIFC